MLSFQRQEKYLKHCLSNSCAKKIAKDLARFKKYFAKELKCTDSALDAFVDQNPGIRRNFELLVSIPGIGRVISLYTILYTKNFGQITCPRKFACFAGVVPFKNESGTSVRKGNRVSFYANRNMKGMLNFGAMNAVRADPQLRAYYQKKTAEKNSKVLVLNAVRNKLVHRMFAVAKRGTPYVARPVF
jgi:transposase